jgi:biopolymer transport protein ExbD
LLLQGCSKDPPVVDALLVTIDAQNNCTMESAPVDCNGVAAVIRTRYPTSRPRIDICLAKETRYEAALEVMNSVTDAGFPVGMVECPKPG